MMPGWAGAGLLSSVESGDHAPLPLEMPLWGGFGSFLRGREENGEKGQQEMTLTHTGGRS